MERQKERYSPPAQPHIPYALLSQPDIESRLVSIEEIVQDQVEAFRWRVGLRIQKAAGGDEAVFLRCPRCRAPLQLKALSHRDGADHTLYFSHGVNAAATCELAQEGGLPRHVIEAMIYDGVRESERHRRLKSWVARMAEKTPGLEVESLDRRYVTGAGADGRAHRRKPDVLLRQNGTRIALELQISPTFTQVIADRHVAYRSLGVPLVWLADNFNPNAAQAFHKDIVEQNGGFMFSLDDKVRRVSEKAGKLIVRLWRRTHFPQLNRYFWGQNLVEFGEIDFHRFAFQPGGEFLVSTGINAGLVSQIEAWLIERDTHDVDGSIFNARLESVGLGEVHKCHFVLKALLSIRDGTVHSNQSWKWLANQILSSHSKKLRPIVFAAQAYNREEEIFPKQSPQYRRMRGAWKGAEKSVSKPFMELCVTLLPELRGRESHIWPETA